jgi:hypothetical protein
MEYEQFIQDEQLNKRVLRIINNCLLAYVIPLTLILMVLPADPLVFVNNLSMVLLVLAYELLQERVKNFLWYSVGHVICLYLLFLFSVTYGEFWIRLIVGMAAMVINYVTRIRETYAIYPYWPLAGLGFAIYLIAAYIGSKPLSYIGYITEIVYAVIILLYYNARSLEYALERSVSHSQVPLDKILHTNRLIVTIWGVVAGVLIFLSTLITFGDELFALIGRGLRFLLRCIVRFLIWFMSLFPERTGTAGGRDHLEEYLQMMGGAPESHPILDLIFTIVRWGLVALAVFFVGRLLVRSLRDMYGNFNEAGIGEVEEKVFDEPDDEEQPVARPNDERLRFLDRSPAARIRRSYVTLIRRSPHLAEVRDYHTPHELEVASGARADIEEKFYKAAVYQPAGVRLEEASILDQIHLLYEKARYTPEACTRDDADKMRDAVGRLRRLRQPAR